MRSLDDITAESGTLCDILSFQEGSGTTKTTTQSPQITTPVITKPSNITTNTNTNTNTKIREI